MSFSQIIRGVLALELIVVWCRFDTLKGSDMAIAIAVASVNVVLAVYGNCTFPALRTRASATYCLGHIGLFVIVFCYAIVDGGSDAAVKALLVDFWGLLIPLSILLIVDPQRDEQLLRWCALVSTLIVSISVIGQFFGLWLQGFDDYNHRPGGLYVNPNGASLAISLLAAYLLPIRRNREMFVGAVLGVAVFATVLTNSRSGGLQLGVVVLAWFVSMRVRSAPLIFLMCAVLAYAVLTFSDQIFDKASLIRLSMQDDSAESRIQLLSYNLERLARHPLFGSGLGSSLIFGDEILGTHNTFLSLAVEFGLVVAFGYLVWLLRLLYLIPRRSTATVLVFIVGGIFSHNMIDSVPTMLVLALAAATRGEGHDARESAIGVQPFRTAPS